MLREKLLPISENRMLLRLNIVIDRILAQKQRFVVWGAGNTGRITCDYIDKYSKHNCKPEYVVDNNKMFWDNGLVKCPDDFKMNMSEIEVALVCVYVADQVVEQLKAMGYKGDIVPISASVFDVDNDCIQHYTDHLEEIEEVYASVADEKSKKVIETYINVIRTGNIDLWEGVNSDSTYKLLDPQVITFSANEHFVDVGAFTGDTLDCFLRNTGDKYGSIVCIEPDESNYCQVRDKIDSKHLHDAYAINAAVGAENGIMSFRGDVSESCILSDDGDKQVKVVALDNVDEAKNVTLLKISTNGFDLNALKGAELLIKRNRPKIATYISGDQLWTVTKYILEIVPEYKLYVRHYGIGRQAMILYAISKK